MAERFGELQVQARAKIKQASDRFHSWFDQKMPDQQSTLRCPKEKLSRTRNHDYDEGIDCPACGSRAHMLGSLDAWEEPEGPGETSFEWTIVIELKCGVCDLDLDELELSAVGIEWAEPEWRV